MNQDVKCEDCRHHYIHNKKIRGINGNLDFIPMLKCRKRHRILMGGQPGCDGKDFEPKGK